MDLTELPAAPLFTLTIEQMDEPPNDLPFSFPPLVPKTPEGAWEQQNNTYLFITDSTDQKKLGLRIQPNKHSPILPILDYAAKKRIKLVLQGKQQADHYHVYDIRPKPPEFGTPILSPWIFRKAINYLQKPVSSLLDPVAPKTDLPMVKDGDLNAYFQICRQELPVWVQNACQENSDILNQGAATNSDKRRHAHRAMELLLNIDWDPLPLRISSAEQAREILDRSFYGLEQVKSRIEEVIAQIRATGKLPKWGILLCGPAGTGKTSIAKAIANLLSLPLIQLNMESADKEPLSIAGSPRHYSNAEPGEVLKNMYKNRSCQGCLLINELDKPGKSEAGRSVADSLLSLLDKTGFYDNFLEQFIPTGDLFCIATCNELDRISKPLLDRFCIIDIGEYSQEEKKTIFADYILPSLTRQADLAPDTVQITDDAISLLVRGYAPEPGVRDLEQIAERMIGNYFLQRSRSGTSEKRYTCQDIQKLFGPPKAVVHRSTFRPGEVNVACIHANSVQFFLLQASVVPGTGNFQVLGPISGMQREYCKAAYLCARSTAAEFSQNLDNYDVHLFSPHPIPEDVENYIGFACYCAIRSGLLETKVASQKSCFFGGCDLNGSLYSSEHDLTPILRAMQSRGITTLYAPAGSTSKIDPKVSLKGGITVFEAYDAATLFQLAACHHP